MLKWMLSLILSLAAAEAFAFQSAEASVESAQAYTQGYAAVTQKDWAAAIPLLEKAVSLNPEMFVSHFWIGVSYQAQNNAEKAIEHYKTFVAKAGADPGSTSLVQQATRECGVILAKQKKLAEATPLLEKAVAAKADDVEARYLLGLALLSSENKDGAEAHFAKLMELKPDFALPFWYAGRIAYDRKDDEAARSRLEGFLALNPEKTQAAAAHLMLGNLALRMDSSERALTHFEKYLEVNPAGAQADAVRKNVESLKAGASAAPKSESSGDTQE
ncbi:MAG: tetratricopeptide repeat protein [Vicinamibacteria bacterium]|nr:tetratricopeptide repeat protein [Vicinamibacteria bacterium]